MRKTLLVLTLVGAWAGNAHVYAQRTQQPQDVYKILGISVEGATLADPAAVIANSGLRIGDELLVPSDQVGQAVRKLWGLKIFDDVQIAIDRKAGNGVYLVIKVKELPRYERTEITGRDEIKESDIEKKIPYVRGQVVQPQNLVKIKKDITKLYEDEGMLLADVKVTTVPVDTAAGRVILKVDIDEGKEVKVRHISFQGNVAYDDGDLRGAMDDTKQAQWWKFW